LAVSCIPFAVCYTPILPEQSSEETLTFLTLSPLEQDKLTHLLSTQGHIQEKHAFSSWCAVQNF